MSFFKKMFARLEDAAECASLRSQFRKSVLLVRSGVESRRIAEIPASRIQQMKFLQTDMICVLSIHLELCLCDSSFARLNGLLADYVQIEFDKTGGPHALESTKQKALALLDEMIDCVK